MKSDDRCQCGGPCPNGVAAITIVQVVMLLGAIFSTATLVGCRFVSADLSLNSTNYERVPGFLPQAERQGYGFFIFENPSDGQCWWDFWSSYNHTQAEDNLHAYLDFYNDSWKTGFSFGVVSANLAFWVWVWTMFLCCVSHTRALRCLLGGFLLFVLTPLQGFTFVVYSSDFCDAYKCEFDQSAGFSFGAMLCFFFSGITLVFCTKNFPGVQKDDCQKETSAARVVVAVKGPPSDQATEDLEDPANSDNVAKEQGPITVKLY